MVSMMKNKNQRELLLLNNQRYFKEKHDFNSHRKYKKSLRYGINFSTKKNNKSNERKEIQNNEATRNSSQRARSGQKSRRRSYFYKQNPSSSEYQNKNDDSANSTGNLQEIEEDKEELKDSKAINKHLRKMIQYNLVRSIANPEEEYQKELERKQKLRVKARQIYNEVSAKFKSVSQTELYKYIICNGNNSEVVSMCMKKRKNWEETSYYNTIFNFKWQPTSKGIKFDLVSKNGQKQMVNHFENHKAITTKDNLFRCLQRYCEAYVYDYVPITFLIETNSDNFKADLDKFKMVFNILKPYDEKSIDGDTEI